MSVLFHSLVVLSYAALGAAVAFDLPLLSAGILVVGALSHQSVVHGSRGRLIARKLSVVTSASVSMQRDLELARNELHDIKTQFGGGNLHAPGGANLEANTRSSNEVLSELRLLRTLFAQLTSKKGAKKNVTPAKAALPRQHGTPVIGEDPGTAKNFGDLDLSHLSRPASEYRASYMNLTSSLHDQPRTEPEPVPSGQAQPASDSPPLDSNAQDILEITRDALERARVSLFLQPIVSLPTRWVEYYEAYSRIQDHAGNFIGPQQYLEPAERAGLVGAIDNNLLFRCIQLLRRVRRHNREYDFFCNVSPHTLRDETFFAQFVEFLSENLELADDLIFEFSQTGVETHYNEFAENLDRLAKLGFSFSIDRVERLDLNFVEIAKRNFHYVKVDASNLISLVQSESGQEKLRYLQENLSDSRVTMIVEKIETEPQLVELLDLQIRYGQGYLFGEPRESKT